MEIPGRAQALLEGGRLNIAPDAPGSSALIRITPRASVK